MLSHAWLCGPSGQPSSHANWRPGGLVAGGHQHDRLNPRLFPRELSAAEMRNVRRVALRSLGASWPGCGAPTDVLHVYRTPLGRDILLVSAGPGGCRGGQGSNGALWLVRHERAGWEVLASPEDGFSGWGLGVQPHGSRGFPDLVVGWHLGADDFSLSYFRFNGHHYRRVSGMEFRGCGTEAKFCLQDGRLALNTGSF